MVIYSGGGQETRPHATSAGVWGIGVCPWLRRGSSSIKFHRTGNSSAHAPGAFDARLVRYSVCGRIFRYLPQAMGKGFSGLADAETFGAVY